MSKAAPADWRRWLGPSLRSLPTMAWVLAGAQLINRMGGAVRIFMPLYLHQALHLPIEMVGWLLACNGLGMLAGAYGGGLMNDHWPARRLALIMLCGSAGCFLLYLCVEQPILLALVMMASGFMDTGFRPQIHRLIMETCSAESRVVAQSLNRVSINLAVSVAGVMGGLAASHDYRIVFIIDSLTSALAALWLWWALRRHAGQAQAAVTRDTTGERHLQGPYQDGPLLAFMFGSLILRLVLEAIYSQLGNYTVSHYRLGPEGFGWQIALNGLLIVAVQIPLTSWCSRNAQPPLLMLAGALLMGLASAMLPLGQGVVWLSFSTVVWTVAEMVIMPTVIGVVMQRAEGRRTGHYLGIYTVAWSVASLLSPVCSSQLIRYFGAERMWYVNALCCVLAMPLLWRTSQRLQVEENQARTATVAS